MWLSHPLVQYRTAAAAGQVLQPVAQQTVCLLYTSSTAELLRVRKKASYSPWIFHNPLQPEAPMNPSTAYHQLKKILQENKLPDIRFHDLRHTFATHALANGVDAKTLSGILGHTKASFTVDTYTLSLIHI